MALVLFTAVSQALHHTVPGPQTHSGGADEGKEQVQLVADDEPPWVDAMGQGLTGGYFPGVHQRQLRGTGSPRG